MQFIGIKSLLFLSLIICGLSLSALMADEAVEWKAVHRTLAQYSDEIAQSKKDLEELGKQKSTVLSSPRSTSHEDRELANVRPQNEDAKAEKLRIEIRSLEAKVDRTIKKKDFLIQYKTNLQNTQQLDTQLQTYQVEISQNEKALKTVEVKIAELSKTCSKCKLSLLVNSRQPASGSENVREFQELLYRRNQLQDQIEILQIRTEALRELRNADKGVQSTEQFHRLDKAKPFELMR